MNKMNLLGCAILILTFFSCNSNKGKEIETAVVVAQAGEEKLDEESFISALGTDLSASDSALRANRYIEKWAIEALFYQEAVSKLDEEEIQIEKQINEYRQSLVNHLYETKVVEANLDTTINAQEIEEYYNEHRDNFILKDNIVKVQYFKIAERSAALPKIKKILYSSAPKDKELLLNLLSENADNFFMNDSTWLLVDDIRKEIPSLREQENFTFSTGRVLEINEEGVYYFLKVKDVMTKNSYSPLNFERNNIRKFILNNRKTQLVNQYKQSLLEKAKAEKTFTVYKRNP